MLVGRWNVLLSPGPFSVDFFPFFLCVHFLFPPVSYQQKSWKLRKPKNLHRTNQPWLLQVHLETTSLMGSTPLERRFVGLGRFFGPQGRKPDRRAPTIQFLRCDVAVFWAKAIIKKNWKTKMLKKFVSERTCRIQSFPKKSFIWNTQLGSW